MRIAITGVTGQLGRALVERLGSTVIAMSRADLNLTVAAAVARSLEAIKPDVLINTAAYTNVERAEEEAVLCRQVNADGVRHLALWCAANGARLVQVCTDYVFGGDRARRTPYSESDAPAPLNVYGRAKLAGEEAAAMCPQHLIVRTCGLYGSLTTRTSFVEAMLRLGQERRHVRGVNDQVCTPSNVSDVADAVLKLVRAEAEGIYRVTNSGSTHWCVFAEAIFRLARLPVRVEPISSAEYGARAERPAFSVLDTSRYTALAGAPLRPWEDALAEFLSLRLDRFP